MMKFNLLRRLRKDDKGATAIEYGLIAALISVAAIASFGTVGKKLNTAWTNISNTMTAQGMN